jgi:hypothetical protein
MKASPDEAYLYAIMGTPTAKTNDLQLYIISADLQVPPTHTAYAASVTLLQYGRVTRWSPCLRTTTAIWTTT